MTRFWSEGSAQGARDNARGGHEGEFATRVATRPGQAGVDAFVTQSQAAGEWEAVGGPSGGGSLAAPVEEGPARCAEGMDGRAPAVRAGRGWARVVAGRSRSSAAEEVAAEPDRRHPPPLLDRQA